jgi:hypothetical protein
MPAPSLALSRQLQPPGCPSSEGKLELYVSPILDTQKAADYLSLRPQTLRAWRHRGGGPPYFRLVPGNLRSPCRYRLEDLDAWLQARRFTSTSEETTKLAAG